MTTYTYWECPACEWSCVLNDAALSGSGQPCCRLCAEDNGRLVDMKGRPAQPDDKPEGFDDRIAYQGEEGR